MKSWRSFPQMGAGFYPTPIEEMPRLRKALGGGPRLFIKRDDYTGPGFGGNKVRKVEFVMARALAEGADTVITTGGIRSNHARVTAALAARAGLECHLVLNGDAAPVPASTFLDELYGATIHHVVRRDQRDPTMERIASELAAARRRPYTIPLGASLPLGALGYVRAAEEILESGVAFDAVFHSTSSGGTQAGLAAGLADSETRVIGISADDSAIEIAARVGEIVGGIGDLLEKKIEAKIDVDAGFVGEGYGIPTAAGEEALDLFARYEGVVLDPVYTAKAAAGMIARVRAGEFREGQSVLFVHTGGQLALFSR